MQARITNRWDAVRDSFWFVPLVMSVAAMVLAWMCTVLDDKLGQEFADLVPWIGVSTTAARASLGTIASAMVSIAGIVFSVMLVMLSITSSQYGSRLLRTFLSDRVTQLTLGVLVGTSLFCMVSLAGIQEHPEGDRSANVTVILGLVLAAASLTILVGFIHHVANLIQAPNVVAAVAHDLDGSLKRLFPEQLGDEPKEAENLSLQTIEDGVTVRSASEGYVQAIDTDAMMSIATSNNLFIRLAIKPGDFIELSQPILEVWPGNAVAGLDPQNVPPEWKIDQELERSLSETVVTGNRRTPRQDAECALDELVEVAVRALSPGINDPFTAIVCVDRIAAALGRIGSRSMPVALRRDEQHVPRVLARATTFGSLMDAAFNQIRQYGCRSVAVAIRMLEAIGRISHHVTTDSRREVLIHHATMLQRDFRRHVQQPADGDDFQRRFDEVMEALEPAAANDLTEFVGAQPQPSSTS